MSDRVGRRSYGGPLVKNGLLDAFPKQKSRFVARFQKQLLGAFGLLGKAPFLARPVSALSRRMVGSFLYAIKLEVNRTCNLKCKMCYVSKSPESLPFDTITDLLDQIRSCHVRLEILGGEPLLRDDIVEIVAYAKREARLPFVSIYTNGLRVSPELAIDLKRAGLDAAIVTVISHEPEVHDRFVGRPGAWDATTAGIRLLRDAGIDTYTFTAIHRENIDDVRQLHDFVANELEVGPVFYPYIPQRKDDPLTLTDWQAWREIKHWLLYEKFPDHMEFIRDFYMLTGHACSGGNFVFTVKADGRVQPCPFIDDLPLGSIYEQKFWDIYATRFDHPSFCEFKDVPRECRGCSYVSVCAGGCKAGNMELFGRYNCKDHRCPGPFRDPIDSDEVVDRLPVFF